MSVCTPPCLLQAGKDENRGAWSKPPQPPNFGGIGGPEAPGGSVTRRPPITDRRGAEIRLFRSSRQSFNA